MNIANNKVTICAGVIAGDALIGIRIPVVTAPDRGPRRATRGSQRADARLPGEGKPRIPF